MSFKFTQKQLNNEIDEAIHEKVFNFPFNGLVTADRVNKVFNHLDNKLNIILKNLKGGK